MPNEEEVMRCRTIWLSDIHLGTRDCKAEFLIDFLRCYESDKIYLVGDIIDGWSLKRQWYWPPTHSTVIQKILRKSRKGTEVIFIPGNHDEFLRPYVGLEFGDIKLMRDDIHVTADGKRLKMGLSYWSLSATLKQKVKKAIQIISDFEYYLVDIAKRHQADGVVCGHIHHAEIKTIGSVLYCNDGDWVESCTALVEWLDGRLEIVRWTVDNSPAQEETQFSFALLDPNEPKA